MKFSPRNLSKVKLDITKMAMWLRPLRFSRHSLTRFNQLIILSITSISVFIIVFISIASFLVVHPIKWEPQLMDIPYADADISLAFEVISADPIARTLMIDWYPIATVSCADNSTLVADIYVDIGSLDESSPSFTNGAPYTPSCQLNMTEICLRNDNIFPLFRTVSKLRTMQSSPFRVISNPPQASTLQNYPFDVYFAPQGLHALDHETGAFISMNISYSYGVAVNFDVTVSGFTYIDFGETHPQINLSLTVTRSRATKLFVVIIAVTDWLIATAFLMICSSTLVYRSPKIYAEMFIVPVGAVLSLTSVRANLPGAPVGFGATIDSYTILPALVIMALCSFYLLLIVLYRRLNAEDSLRSLNLQKDLESAKAPQATQTSTASPGEKTVANSINLDVN